MKKLQDIFLSILLSFSLFLTNSISFAGEIAKYTDPETRTVVSLTDEPCLIPFSMGETFFHASYIVDGIVVFTCWMKDTDGVFIMFDAYGNGGYLYEEGFDENMKKMPPTARPKGKNV